MAKLLENTKKYILQLKDQSDYWKNQAAAWGIVLVVAIFGGLLFTVLALSSVFGGGNIRYQAPGSPGPVLFRHYTHMTFQGGKYKDCKSCHDAPFATQQYGTYVLRALKNAPAKKIRIGRETSTLYVSESLETDEPGAGYEVPRACATCATGNCHDGKESFSKLDCLSCHMTR